MWPDDRPGRILFVGAAAAMLWLVLSLAGLWLLGGAGAWLARIIAIALPLGLIALATAALANSVRLRDEAETLRHELERLRARPRPEPEPAKPTSPPPPDRPAPSLARPARPAAEPTGSAAPPVAFSSRRDIRPAAGSPPASQGQLALDGRPEAEIPPLPIADLVTALNFPETAEDTDGFRALRRALRDHRTAELIQAAQDVLTLLSQDGIYMDDLTPDRAHPDLWRRFSKGERGGQLGQIGGIRDRAALSLSADRMREDPVFRDAAHHFLRRFDRLLAAIEPRIEDADLVRLGDTRTARAFMVLGRVSSIFD